MLPLEKIRKDLEGQSEDARYEAWLALYTSSEKEAQEELTRITRSDDPILKVFLLRFLAHIDQEKAVEMIVSFLQDKNSVVAEAAQKSFDRNRCNGKLKKLISLLHSSHKPAKYFAIERLAVGGEFSVLNDLLFMLKDADKEWLLKLLMALRYLAGSRTIPFLLPFLKEEREDIRFRSVLVLGAIFESGYFPVKKILLGLLKDPSPRIRRTVLWSLQRHPSKRDIPILKQISLKDEDSMVRQESLVELGSFPTKEVIEHLLNFLVLESNRLLMLKAEGILLSMPVDALVKGLRGLLHKKNPKIRNKAMLLFAQFEKNSKPYLKFLMQGLARATEDKEKLVFIEALGIIEAEPALPLLEKELHGSYLVAYVAMVAIIKIWKVVTNPPLLIYLKDKKLHPLLRQMVLKYLVKKGKPEFFDDALIDCLNFFLSDVNTNIRYLAAQGLVVSGREGVLSPLFQMILSETDPIALRFLEEHALHLLSHNPSLFFGLFQAHRKEKRAVGILFDMLKMGTMSEKQILDVLMLLLDPPLHLMQTEHEGLCIDFVYTLVVNKRVSLESLLRRLFSAPEKGKLIFQLSEKLKNVPFFRTSLSFQTIRQGLATDDVTQKEGIITLLGMTVGTVAIAPLVAIVCDDKLKGYHQKASVSLNHIFRGGT